MNRIDKFRRIWIIVEHAPNGMYAPLQSFFAATIATPNGIQQFIAANDNALCRCQIDEDIHWLLCEWAALSRRPRDATKQRLDSNCADPEAAHQFALTVPLNGHTCRFVKWTV